MRFIIRIGHHVLLGW